MPDEKPTAPRSPNRTRDHLANERTFLAWIRTSLGLIGLGFVLARMGLFLRQLAATATPARPPDMHGSREFLITGVVFLVLGTFLCGWAAQHYHRSRRAIDAETFEPATGAINVLTVAAVIAGAIIVGLVIVRTLAGGVM